MIYRGYKFFNSHSWPWSEIITRKSRIILLGHFSFVDDGHFDEDSRHFWNTSWSGNPCSAAVRSTGTRPWWTCYTGDTREVIRESSETTLMDNWGQIGRLLDEVGHQSLLAPRNPDVESCDEPEKSLESSETSWTSCHWTCYIGSFVRKPSVRQLYHFGCTVLLVVEWCWNQIWTSRCARLVLESKRLK